MGRNRVVQLGDGLGDFCDMEQEVCEAPPVGTTGELVVDRMLVTAVPLKITIEKLRGFVLDHDAEIVSIKADRIQLDIKAEHNRAGRRRSDRPIPFTVDVELAEQRVATPAIEGRLTGQISRTRLRVAIRLKRPRDRRANDLRGRNGILASLKSYLMACDDTATAEAGPLRRASSVSSLWLNS